MPEQLLHISFRFKGPLKVKDLEPTFNKAKDWCRYAPNCWLVWTTVSEEAWYRRLKPLLGPDDYMLIAQVQASTMQGWQPQWVWDWIHKYDPTPRRPAR